MPAPRGCPLAWWEWRRIMPALAQRFSADDRRRNKMDIGWKSARVLIALLLLSICWSARQGPANVALAAPGNTNGAAGQMPAYYDDQLFTVNMKEMPHSDPLL